MDRKLEILAAIGSSEPGTQYVRLTPSEPTVPWKGAFVFVAPRLVEGGQGYARFTQHSLPGAGPSRAVLWLHSANYRKYLIDCAVDGTYHTGGESELWGGGPVLTVAGPGSESQVFDFRQAWSPNGYHLVFGFEAGGAGWYSFTITSGASQPGTGVRWELHACEVTNL